MADTIRTIPEILALLADNTTGDISPQDMRDSIVSLANAYEQQYTSGWADMIVPLTQAYASNPKSPSFDLFGPAGTLRQWHFTKGQELYLTLHVPHDIATGSLMYMHMHWTTDGVTAGTVLWDIEYSIAKGHNQESFPASTTMTVGGAASGIAWQHMISEDTVGVVAPEPDSLVILRIQRSEAAGDTNTDKVFGLELDIHYQSDRRTTKNRFPPFNV